MSLYSLCANKNKRKIIRLIFLIIGSVLIIMGILKAWFLILAGLYFLVMTVFIKDIELHLYNNRIELLHISIIKKLNNTELFPFDSIKSIKFDKGFTNWKRILIEGDMGFINKTQSKKDTIEITMKDGSWRIINRIGAKNKFYHACQQMLNQLKSIQNSN